MQLADTAFTLQMPTISQLETGIQSAATTTPAVNAPSSSGGDFWSGLLNTVGKIGTVGLQVYGGIKQAQAYQAAGIQPMGYRNGVPVYGSTPAGVTPANPFSLPSGSALPAGVTPGYSLVGGNATIVPQTVNPISNFLSSGTGKAVMIGSTVLLVMLAMQKKRRR